ncbi:unnamed protein product [Cuscuta epithymum]|uniref:NPF family transporter n=1 Tax=Cuscuta epithymum TaxID=186058 RepID=A0AAV0C2M3_9ASTE|nr:unnamed protein product [Cuscuta epithymum]
MCMVAAAMGANMIVYLMKEFHMEMASASNYIYIFSALSNTAPIIGAFMADSLGTLLIWLPTAIMQAKPRPCSESSDSCTPATTPQLILLCTALIMTAVGCGGVTSSSLAFGADQLKHFQNNASKIESYFSWSYATGSFSAIVGSVGLVYLQENYGWRLGYGVLVALALFAVLTFFSGSVWYLRPNPTKNLVNGLFNVMVASYRNRHIKLFSGDTELQYHSKGSALSHPSDKLRFLNKACIIQDPERDLNADGTAVNPWKLCTVDQVEELKSLIKVIPIWITRIVMSLNICQGSFAVLQATSLDRHIGSKFQLPAGSVSSFAAVFIVAWIILYDRILLPLASRIRGKTVHFSTKSRMGCGIFISFLSMAAMATVESMRRAVAINEGYENNPDGVIHMSILWVLPQYALMGFAEGLNGISQNEFYISEFPKSMSSIASSLCMLSSAIASLLSSFLMTTIDNLTKRGGKESWISSNINKGHYDYLHWVLAGLSITNFLCYLAFSKAYGPLKDENFEAKATEEDGKA